MKFIYTLVIIFFAHLLTAQCGDRYKTAVFPTFTRYSNLVYGLNYNNLGQLEALHMDVYTPDGDTATNRPLILFVHGGSFVGGDKRDGIHHIAEDFARKGYVTASINYRVHLATNPGIDPILEFVSIDNWHAAIIRAFQDMKAAIRYFKKDVAVSGNTYRIDTTNIILYGSSAGAIAALHGLFLTDTAQAAQRFRKNMRILGGLEGESGNPGYTTTGIRAIVSASGAVSDPDWIQNRQDVAYIGFHNNPDLTVPYDIGCFVTAMCHLGTYYGGKRIAIKAEQLGMNYEFYTFNLVGHPADQFDEPFVISKMTDFLYKLQCEEIPVPVFDKRTEEVKIFPNPAGREFTIQSTAELSAQWCRILLYDMSGAVVLDREFLLNGSTTIDEHLAPGLYQLQLIPSGENGKVYLGKVVVTK